MSAKGEASPVPHTHALGTTPLALMGLDTLEPEVIDEARQVAIGFVDDRPAGLDRRSAHIERRQSSTQLGVTLVDSQRGPLPQCLAQEPGRRATGDPTSDDGDVGRAHV
jgi:hypothetical protein